MRNTYLILCFVITTLLFSCQSETEQQQISTVTDTTNQLTSSSSLKPFEPDDNFVLPKEATSQYGPVGIIRDVEIDANGVIWMAAWDGVVSYDGKQFTNHTLKDGLSHHRVFSVMEDSKGNMWFGTMGAGAYKFDGTRFTNISSNTGLASNIVFDIFEDHGGNIWFATDSGASRYSELPGAKIFTNISEKDSLKGSVQAISQDKNGAMWFGTSYGLYQYSPVTQAHGAQGMRLTELVTESETPYSNVRDLYCDLNGVMWIAAARGLYQCTPVNRAEPKIASVNEKFTGYVRGSKNGNLLLTSDGIYRYDCGIYEPAYAEGNRYTTIVGDANNLGIFGAREAEDGTIWYGAMDGLHSVRDGKDVSYKKP